MVPLRMVINHQKAILHRTAKAASRSSCDSAEVSHDHHRFGLGWIWVIKRHRLIRNNSRIMGSSQPVNRMVGATQPSIKRTATADPHASPSGRVGQHQHILVLTQPSVV